MTRIQMLEKDEEQQRVCDRLRELLADPDLDPDDPRLAQELLGTGIKLLGQMADQGKHVRPYPEDQELSASEVAITACLLLQAADIEIFELAMWKTWADQTRFAETSDETA